MVKEYVLEEIRFPPSSNVDDAGMYAYYATCLGHTKQYGTNCMALLVKVD
jgi:hypothetical protein